MRTAVNKDFTQDTILRISPERDSIIVEEHLADGAVKYKKISLVDLYFALNESYICRDFLNTGFLPENCLCVSMSGLEKNFVLWNPELRADFRYGELEYPDFPIPRMVFGLRVLESGKVAECSIGVVADEKPTPETVMYHYPFANVYDSGKVCSGNNVLPRYRKQTALRNFPRYLLGIPDNDDLYDPAKNRLGLEHGALLEYLKDKNPGYYYTDILVPNGKTLDDFISGR